MACNVVCISSADGAGGTDVGRQVARTLGFRLVDEEIVQRAAREAGVEPRLVANAERRKSFLARLLEDLGPSSEGAAYSLGAFVPLSAEELAHSSDELRGLIRTAVEETAARGECVIVSHAASFAVADRPSCLRVLVTASAETRRHRIAAERKLDVSKAAKLVEEGDSERAAYLKRFYGVRTELPTHYDIVVTTDRLTTEQAAAAIVHAATAAAAEAAPIG